MVDEGGVAGSYRGTIATGNRIRGICRTVWVAIAGAGAVAVAITVSTTTIRLTVLALVNEGYGKSDGEDDRHKSAEGDGQPCWTAIKRSCP